MSRLPGLGTSRTATPRHIFWGEKHNVRLPQGKVVDASESRDAGNTGNLTTLRAGILMGKITTGGLFAPSIIGVLSAEADGDTLFTVNAATAVELVRRVSTGVVTVYGPPSTGGTGVALTGTISTVDVATGIVTLAASLGAVAVIGSIVCATDGSQIPRGILAVPYGIKVTDSDAVEQDMELADLCIGGIIDTDQVINFTAEPTIQAYIKQQLRLYGAGYAFKNDFDA